MVQFHGRLLSISSCPSCGARPGILSLAGKRTPVGPAGVLELGVGS